MFFILSKTLNVLAMPVVIVFILFVLAGFLKNSKWKKRCFWSGLVLFFLFTNDFISNEFMAAWEIKPVAYAEMQPYDLGVVLTGATISGLEPTDRVYFQRGADRVVHTVQLYKLGLIKTILISGGTGRLVDEGYREALEFRDAMLTMGVPEEAILIEKDTRNTHESAVAVKEMIGNMEMEGKRMLLITSAFHMRRSLACYRKVGLNPDPFTTDFYAHQRVFYPDTFIVPRIEAMMVWHKLIREWAGMIAYKIAGYV